MLLASQANKQADIATLTHRVAGKVHLVRMLYDIATMVAGRLRDVRAGRDTTPGAFTERPQERPGRHGIPPASRCGRRPAIVSRLREHAISAAVLHEGGHGASGQLTGIRGAEGKGGGVASDRAEGGSRQVAVAAAARHPAPPRRRAASIFQGQG